MQARLALSALASCAFLSACGGGDASAPASARPAPTAQTITFAGPGNQTLGTAPPLLVATANSGLPVTIASTTASVCTVSGNTLTLVSAGTCTLDASQAGNATYAAATDVMVSFTVAAPLQSQTISFTSPGNQVLGATPPALSATASSGLPVTITSKTGSVCTVSGTALTLVANGTCTLAADQAGNATYAAAAQQTVTFTVSGGVVSALTFSSGFAAGNLTNEGGAYFGYGGSNLDGYNCTGGPSWCGSGGGGSGANSSFYVYYQTPTPATALFDGASVLAPGVTKLSTTGDTAGVQVNGQTSVNFTFNDNPEWFASGTNNFGVILTLGKLYSVGSPPGPCNIKLLAVVAPLNGGAATAYSIPFSSFAVIQNCGTSISTPAAALASAPVSAIDFQGAGGTAALPPVNGLTTGANLSVPTGSPAVYPTTVALKGAITFQP